MNRHLRDAVAFIRSMNFCLPPFAFWSPQDWLEKGPEYDEIRDNMLGWDLTDFGSGNYLQVGLLLFTLRNGNLKNSRYIKPYAEKLMLVREGQVTPLHFHTHKMEDIINRGGGNLLVQVYNATEDGSDFLGTPVEVSIDGRTYPVEAGSLIRIKPGESIAIPAGQYHKFWGEKGYGTILLGEVSKVNDDVNDNRFHDAVGRFPAIEEDEPPLYYLCNEYPAAGVNA
ncbi:MAG TPA: D-lyxose/D-mannose family sugar isomerase [Clostridiales bacterium]|nr:D-lyxose/D-mannose family sugar isomerase [Clostridiales bacterium]